MLCFSVSSFGFRFFAFGFEGFGKVEIAVGVIGREFDDRFKLGDGFVNFSGFEIGDSGVEREHRGLPGSFYTVKPRRFLQFDFRAFDIAFRAQGCAECVVNFRRVGQKFERGAKKPNRFVIISASL